MVNEYRFLFYFIKRQTRYKERNNSYARIRKLKIITKIYRHLRLHLQISVQIVCKYSVQILNKSKMDGIW